MRSTAPADVDGTKKQLTGSYRGREDGFSIDAFRRAKRATMKSLPAFEMQCGRDSG